MRLTILGCGTSTGVPTIQCKCSVCTSDHPRNKRLRASVWIQIGQKSFLVDTSPDLRQQAIRENIPSVDAVLFTHPHADHVHGIDDLRMYNFIQKGPIPAFGNSWTCRELQQKFAYIFKPGPIEGGGIPNLVLTEFDAGSPSIDVLGEKVIPLALQHGSKECVGYRINSVAYITDCSLIPQTTLDRLQGLSLLVLDCLRVQPHPTHFNIDQALQTVNILKPKQTILTHLGHELDYVEWTKKLPKDVTFAYDGLSINIV